MEMAVYSVWAAVPVPLRPRLAALMENLHNEFGGPSFEPHVTVVGTIRLSEDDARRRLRSVCKGVRPYTVRFDGVARGTFFYQCVFLLVEPTLEVVEASANSRTHFGFRSSTQAMNITRSRFVIVAYMPHLSLLYGGSKL